MSLRLVNVRANECMWSGDFQLIFDISIFKSAHVPTFKWKINNVVRKKSRCRPKRTKRTICYLRHLCRYTLIAALNIENVCTAARALANYQLGISSASKWDAMRLPHPIYSAVGWYATTNPVILSDWVCCFVYINNNYLFFFLHFKYTRD